MSRIYHGCFRKNNDGTNRIIANNDTYVTTILEIHWRYTWWSKNSLSIQKTKACKLSNFRYLLPKKRKGRHKTMVDGSRFRRSYFKRIRPCLCRLMNYLFGLLTIVNNGNIWWDGRDPRMRYRRRHNEM